MGIPLTTQIKNYSYRKSIYYNGKQGQALLSQMRSYDAMRLTRKIARLGPTQFDDIMNEIHKMLSIKKSPLSRRLNYIQLRKILYK